MTLQRSTRRQWVTTDASPVIMPRAPSITGMGDSPECLAPSLTISGIANRPRAVGIRPMPSQRNSRPAVNRGAAPEGSRPIMASDRPSPPAINPFRREPPETGTTKLTPRTAAMNSSGDPNDLRNGPAMGINAARTSPPKMLPTRELPNAAPTARSASPRRAP